MRSLAVVLGVLLPLAVAQTRSVNLRTITVAPQGRDTAPGTVAEPVATLSRAQALARQERAAGRSVEVIVRGGTYYLPDALVFTPADGGTAEAPVVWRASAGETPVLSGGSRLALTWKPSPLRDGVFEAEVPAGLEIDQLWINGRRAVDGAIPQSGDR